MDNRITNNQVQITGELITNFTFSHEVFGEGFYAATMKALRISNAFDQIPIMVSERLLEVKADWRGCWLNIAGQLRSYNLHTDTKNQLILSVFVREAEAINPQNPSCAKDMNRILLDCYVCKQPVYRRTPLGREITDMLVAVNRPYGKSDYIPCICWGRNARYASSLDVGNHITLEGRIQSREYLKTLGDGTTDLKTAYEISVQTIREIKA